MAMKRVWRVTVEGMPEFFEGVDDALGYIRGLFRESDKRRVTLDSILIAEQEYQEAVQ